MQFHLQFRSLLSTDDWVEEWNQDHQRYRSRTRKSTDSRKKHHESFKKFMHGGFFKNVKVL